MREDHAFLVRFSDHYQYTDQSYATYCTLAEAIAGAQECWLDDLPTHRDVYIIGYPSGQRRDLREYLDAIEAVWKPRPTVSLASLGLLT